MLTVTKPSENRLDIVLSGSLDADAMQTGLDELIAHSDGISDGVMLYTISDFALPSAGALAVEFSRLPKLFALIGRFSRCAVVTDAGWIRTAAEVEGALIPGLTIRTFEPQHATEAETWLTASA